MWQRPLFMEFEALFYGKVFKRSPMDGGYDNIQSSTLYTLVLYLSLVKLACAYQPKSFVHSEGNH
jgi:hypothetical protein